MFDYFQQIDKVHVHLDERPFLYQAYVLNFLIEDCLLSILKILNKGKKKHGEEIACVHRFLF